MEVATTQPPPLAPCLVVQVESKKACFVAPTAHWAKLAPARAIVTSTAEAAVNTFHAAALCFVGASRKAPMNMNLWFELPIHSPGTVSQRSNSLHLFCFHSQRFIRQKIAYHLCFLEMGAHRNNYIATSSMKPASHEKGKRCTAANFSIKKTQKCCGLYAICSYDLFFCLTVINIGKIIL